MANGNLTLRVQYLNYFFDFLMVKQTYLTFIINIWVNLMHELGQMDFSDTLYYFLSYYQISNSSILPICHA